MSIVVRLKNITKKIISPNMKIFLRKLFKKETEVEKYRRRGAKIGAGTYFYSVFLDRCFPYLISIGKNCTLTHCTILSHDGSTHHTLGYSRVGKVSIVQ